MALQSSTRPFAGFVRRRPATPPWWVPIAAAIVPPAGAFVLQSLVWPFIPPAPQLLFYPAVFLAAHFGGARSGYVATALSMLGLAYAFLPPEGSLAIEVSADVLDLTIFGVVASFISATVDRVQEALRRERAAADDARAAREATEATWAMIAHDLRTPLGTIAIGSNILARRLRESGGDLERSARAIERSSSRARSLLQDAVDAMKLNEGLLVISSGPCDVRELFASVLEDVASIAAQSRIRIDVDIATRRAISCDEPRILQVLENLLVNALRFTPSGGTISLHADDDDADVRLSVRDTGPGIEKEHLETIFEKYWTRRGGGGTGLGLWIARALVEAHGRDLSVESRPGDGATFSFALPAHDD